MNKIKDAIKKEIDSFKWRIATFIAKLSKSTYERDILLIPAAELDGGFGDDVMVLSFINHAKNNNKTVTIFTRNVNKRSDYLNSFNNFEYEGGFYNGNYFKFIKLLKKHKSVFILGADIMDGMCGFDVVSNRVRIVLLANSINIEVKYSGFSVSSKIEAFIKEDLVKISKIATLKARDIDSFNRLSSFIDSKKLLLTNDIAFVCPELEPDTTNNNLIHFINWTKSAKQSGKKVIGLCPNSIQASKIGLDLYLKELSFLINCFLKREEFAIAFLYHDYRENWIHTDVTLSKILFDSFNKEVVMCYYTPDIKSGAILKNYISNVDLTITGRMHFGISGLVAKKPMFGISYYNKFEGLMRLFNVNPKITLVDYDKMGLTEDTVNHFIDNYDSINNAISENLNIVQHNCLLNFD